MTKKRKPEPAKAPRPVSRRRGTTGRTVLSRPAKRKTTFPKEVVDRLLVACHRHCCLCHKFAGTKMEVHHIVHKKKGGPDTEENGIPLCFDCHAEAGFYNPDHPKGRNFSEAELRKHKEQWLRIVAVAPWARPPVRLAATAGSHDVNRLVTEIRSRQLWDPPVSASVLGQVTGLGEPLRLELLHALTQIINEEPSDEIRHNASIVIEFLAQWDPTHVPIELLVKMSSDTFFSVRSSAAFAFCHLARMAPATVPLETIGRLATPDEDWYVSTPATTALLYLARTRSVAVEVLANSIGTSEDANDHVATAFLHMMDVAPNALRHDIAERMVANGHERLRDVGRAWKKELEQRRVDGKPLDHYVL